MNASNETLREDRQSIFQDEAMADIFLRGNAAPEGLNDLERLRYRLVIQNVTEAVLEIHAQTVVRGFSPETWVTQGVTLVRRVLGTAGGRWFWREFADNHPPEFRAEVEAILAARG